MGGELALAGVSAASSTRTTTAVQGLNKATMVDLIGRLSNPPNPVEALAERTGSGARPGKPSKGNPRVSSPVQRRLTGREAERLMAR